MYNINWQNWWKIIYDARNYNLMHILIITCCFDFVFLKKTRSQFLWRQRRHNHQFQLYSLRVTLLNFLCIVMLSIYFEQTVQCITTYVYFKGTRLSYYGQCLYINLFISVSTLVNHFQNICSQIFFSYRTHFIC